MMPPNYALKRPGGLRRAGQRSGTALLKAAGAATILQMYGCGRPARSLALPR
jgi:hypothetical protein